MATILDGKATAREIHSEVVQGVSEMRDRHNVVPGLAAILVGDNPASALYVRNKRRACKEVGIVSETFNLSANTSQGDLTDLIIKLNSDPNFHGILVQLPLPEHMDEERIVSSVNPDKDVDCMHPRNVGALCQGNYEFIPATPGGIQQLLLRNGYDPEGKHVVVCGRSNIVGKPLALLLMQKHKGANATVTVCHTGTRDLSEVTLTADILVAAIGRPRAIKVDMVREGTVVVDVGINRVHDPDNPRGYHLEGDVDYEAIFEKAAAITPVPGGVGPMTVAMLLVNTLAAARLSIHGNFQ